MFHHLGRAWIPTLTRRAKTLNKNGSGIAAPSTTFPHTPWCDSDHHDDGTTHPIPDADWQICFSERLEVEFGERDNPCANVDTISAELSFAHTDIWGERADVVAHVDANGVDGFCLTPDQLLPIAKLLLSLDAMYKGDTEAADALMAEARTSVVDIEIDTEREARREAARLAWQEKAEAEEAPRRAEAARQAEEIAEAFRRVRARSPLVVAQDDVAYCERRLAAARRALADAKQAESAGGAA